jgi:hypothetical protein
MLVHTLEVLSKVTEIERTLVVSRDSRVGTVFHPFWCYRLTSRSLQ